MYNLDNKIGRQSKIDEVGMFLLTASGTVAAVPCTIGRRSYLKIVNNDTTDVMLHSLSTASGTNGYLLKASGGEFSDSTNATIYIRSTGANANVNVYERKNR